MAKREPSAIRIEGGSAYMYLGKVVASGERLMGLEPVTWLRLITTGLVEVRGHLRIGITPKGEQALAQVPGTKVNPHGIKGERFPISPRHSGAE